MYWFGKSWPLLKPLCRKWTQDRSRQDWNIWILKYELIVMENLQYSVVWLKQNKGFNYSHNFFRCSESKQSLSSPVHCHVVPVSNQPQSQPQTHSDIGKTSKGKWMASEFHPQQFHSSLACQSILSMRNAVILTTGFAKRFCVSGSIIHQITSATEHNDASS